MSGLVSESSTTSRLVRVEMVECSDLEMLYSGAQCSILELLALLYPLRAHMRSQRIYMQDFQLLL